MANAKIGPSTCGMPAATGTSNNWQEIMGTYTWDAIVRAFAAQALYFFPPAGSPLDGYHVDCWGDELAGVKSAMNELRPGTFAGYGGTPDDAPGTIPLGLPQDY